MSGKDALFLALAEDYDMVILDLMLPEHSGEDVLDAMRSRGIATPVLALTAKDSIADKVHLLDLGADDYMTKPFSFSELSARIRAINRRARAACENVMRLGDLVIDPVQRRVNRAGEEVELTSREFSLLQFMAQNEGRVLTRRVIAEHVWDEQFESFSNVIDVHING
jgi:DNA-binding response OmpR family regulator